MPPLIAAEAGVFALRGAPEAALDLVRAAGGSGTAAISAILAADGSVAAPDRVHALAAEKGLASTTITAVAARRIGSEHPLRAVKHDRLMTDRGPFAGVTFDHAATGESTLALVRGSAEGRAEVPLAVHTSSPAADLLAALAPTGQSGLAQALRRFARVEAGILVHLGERPATDPYALDLVAAVVAELNPDSVLPLDPALDAPLLERGVAVIRPRSTPASEPPAATAAPIPAKRSTPPSSPDPAPARPRPLADAPALPARLRDGSFLAPIGAKMLLARESPTAPMSRTPLRDDGVWGVSPYWE